MSDNRKYYYLKIKENFFDNEEMKILESQKNGIAYQNLYMKLCLLSLKEGGRLMFKGYIPYDVNMLSTILRVDIDTVKTGIELMVKLRLVDVMPDGALYMSDIQTLIGHGSSEAERKAEYRGRIERDKVPKLSGQVPPELELEKDIELKIKKESPARAGSVEGHGLAIDLFTELYEARYHEKPIWDGTTGKLIKGILGQIGKERTLEKIKAYFDREYWFTKDQRRTVAQLSNKLNDIGKAESRKIDEKMEL